MKLRTIYACTFLCFSLNTYAQVENGNFETWTNSTPNGWTTIDSGINAQKSTSIVNSGSASAKITVNTSTQSSTDLRQTINVISGQNYTFSADVYHTEGKVRARLYVDGYRNYSVATSTNQWQTVSFDYTPSSTKNIEVGLRFYDMSGFDGSEVVYIDNFQPSTAASTALPTPTPVATPAGGCSDTNTTLTLVTDSYASETSWELSSAGGSLLDSGSGYANSTRYVEDLCLSPGNYTFTIFDSYGDGICCQYGNGSYEIQANNSTLVSGSSFNSQKSHTFSTISSGSGSGTGGSGSGLGNYYQSAEGLTGYALKTELHNIIKNHQSQGYSALWNFYRSHEVDRYYENDGSILDIYSESPAGSDSYNYSAGSDQCGTYNSEADCYNREHSFPKSWFGGTREPMNSDVHHIFASDGYVNSKRSNHPYGNVGSASFTSNNGSKAGSAASGLGYNGTVFEPIDEFKGDVARAHFYMATRYQDRIASWENNSSNSNAVLNGTSNQVFETWVINLLIQWHELDPVSQKERDRNNAAFNYQGNRNPFVDHPELVKEIW